MTIKFHPPQLLISLCIMAFCACTENPPPHSDNTPHKPTILLTGASFAVPENGWFELACTELGARGINKAVAGSSICSLARLMHRNMLYTTAQLDQIDLFVISHVQNCDVADEKWLKEYYTDYTGIYHARSHAVAYDYVIKRYIADCRALQYNPKSKYYGIPGGKEPKIMFTTHWHDGRTVYNNSIRHLAAKWGFPLVKFDENIGFSRLDSCAGQPSLAVSVNTETIDGTTYGWHPQQGPDKTIQQRMAQIFADTAQPLCQPNTGGQTYTKE